MTVASVSKHQPPATATTRRRREGIGKEEEETVAVAAKGRGGEGNFCCLYIEEGERNSQKKEIGKWKRREELFSFVGRKKKNHSNRRSPPFARTQRVLFYRKMAAWGTSFYSSGFGQT
ncbi:unnamed protein product, partial [Linum tenue]